MVRAEDYSGLNTLVVVQFNVFRPIQETPWRAGSREAGAVSTRMTELEVVHGKKIDRNHGARRHATGERARRQSWVVLLAHRVSRRCCCHRPARAAARGDEHAGARLPMTDGSWSGLASAALAVGIGHSAGPSEAGAVARRRGSSACATSPLERDRSP